MLSGNEIQILPSGVITVRPAVGRLTDIDSSFICQIELWHSPNKMDVSIKILFLDKASDVYSLYEYAHSGKQGRALKEWYDTAVELSHTGQSIGKHYNDAIKSNHDIGPGIRLF